MRGSGEDDHYLAAEELEMSLVTRALRRDRAAFGELYNLYFDRIYRYARLRIGNPADAEDLTAAVFLSAWRTVDHFLPSHDASFASWLFRLAHNAIIDRYRRKRDDISIDSFPRQLDDDRLAHNPEGAIELEMTLASLRRAMRCLTDEQREVVLLRFIEGLSAREVGDIMGKSEGTVRGMQFRAIESLRRQLIYSAGEPLYE